MCGITGIFNIDPRKLVDKEVLTAMTTSLKHRGPDESSHFIDGNVGFGFQRLAIIDLDNGRQPFFDDTKSIMLMCNGEIYNYKELKLKLQKKGYIFKTTCDIEVLVPLYVEYGIDFLKQINGQFAIAIYDKRKSSLILARDHFGICPLYYALVDNVLLFGSEIKALLKNPILKREVNLTGLDQVFSFPGLISPTTMFKNIVSIKPGSYIILKDEIEVETYWDLDYPLPASQSHMQSESYYIEKLEDLLIQSVKYRMNADVPVGFYLSGGLDSSLIGALMKKIAPSTNFESFSVSFPAAEDKNIDESYYQNLVSGHLNSIHNKIPFEWTHVQEKMTEMIYCAEGPLKETYNSCSISLSGAARKKGIKVILSGEGADEFFGGYVGYRFDAQRQPSNQPKTLEELMEAQLNNDLWGDPDFFYEKNYFEFSETKKAIYSEGVNELYSKFNSYNYLEIDKSKLAGRGNLHKRSYLDLKLRLSDHLISDHCDRTCYANSVEGRYPFLDVNLIEFVKTIPDHLKLNNLIEKYILREIGKKYLPKSAVTRQKQGFVAAGSPYFLRKNNEWVNDMLSFDRIKRQGYFNPSTVERIKKHYVKDDFVLNLPFDNDLLIIVLTFNIFLDVFNMPDFNC
ncbi:asparagine synthase (glutamine-hydrolyzing) [Mucilaginibacter sp. RCC_168]|uniref:asparagine synthase (glutamine-hydrolyzing) n=1 Tax=Mucilaginibacter sp. RCC_168 TaxID=3239221 RepID=UPI0035256B8A